MVKPEKIQEVEQIKEILKDAKAVYLSDFTHLTVAEINELRRKLKEKNALYKVIKNTRARFAFEALGYKDLIPYLEGPNALLVAYEDEIEPLKVFFDFKKEVGKGVLKVGELEGRIYEERDLESLSKLPGKKELQAKLVMGLNSVFYRLVNALNWPLSSLVWTLESIKKTKEKEEGN